MVGNFAYVADGTSGLQIINITNPLAPTFAGTLDTPGDASDVVVYGNTAYVADGASGLQIIDVTNRKSPKSVSSLTLTGTARGVDFDPARNIAVIAAGSTGLHVVDISNRASPNRVATLTGGDVRDVVLRGNFAFLADFSRSFTSVDLSIPASPILKMSAPRDTGGLLMDVAVTGQFATGADVLFVNGVPIISITNPDTPQPRAIINFGNFRDDNGTGVAMDGSYVYLTAERGLGTENGVSGDTRLYIGQYTSREDKAGIPPQVTLTSPANNSSVIRGSTINLRANASDDVAVAAVTFTVNGVDVSSDSSEPYEALYTVLDNATTLTIRARAVDLGNNATTTSAVTVTGISDPLTVARGRVLDRSGTAVSGATLITNGQRQGTSGIDGRFSITGVPTILGDIVVQATATIGGQTQRGRSASFAPKPSAITEVGDIALRSARKIALFGADLPDWVADVRAKLHGTGLFTQVDSFPVGSSQANSLPALAQLREYDAVLVWSDLTFIDPTGIGNLLADYSDGGGGVVLATFVFLNSHGVFGRLEQPFTRGNFSNFGNGNSIIPLDPSHPILEGVSTFRGGFSNTSIVVTPGSTTVANWSNGDPLIGIRTTSTGARIVGLNFHPPSSDARADFWSSATDGAKIMANALIWSVR